MADTTVLREFLVRLGFRVDDKGLKNFNTATENASKGVVRLVSTIEGAALTIGAGVAAVASRLEGLYFSSQRTGAAVQSIRAFQSAAQNMGVSAETALGSVEGLARFMRNNPAGEGFIASLGVRTRDANGNLRDTVDLVSDLGAELAKKPTYLSNQYGSMLGIDENLLLAMRNGDFAKYMQQYRNANQSTGFDKAAGDAHKFMIQVRGLGNQFESLGVRVEAALLKKVGPQLERFSGWFDRNGQRIADRVADLALLVLNMAEAIGPAIGWLVDKFIALDGATDGWSTKILGLLVLLKVLGGFQLISGIWGMVTALRAMGVASAAAAAGAAAAGGAGGVAAATGGGLLARFFPWAAGAALLFHHGSLNDGEEEILARQRAKGAAPLEFFKKMGWTHEQAAGIVANLKAESNMRPDAVGDGGKAYGIAQWHPDRQENFRQWSGKDIKQSTLQDQLEFVQHELTMGAERRAGDLLRASVNARQAGEVMSRYYERPKNADAEALARGQAAVDITQNVNIAVNGTGDPIAIARSVGDEQVRVGERIVRDAQGVFQ